MNWKCWFLVVYSIMMVVRSFECPQGEGCGRCRLSFNREVFIMHCATTPTNVVEVQIQPDRHVRLICRSVENWERFHLGMRNRVRKVSSLSFDSCNLPEPNRLGSLTRQLFTEKIESLLFRSILDYKSNITAETFRGLSALQDLTLTSIDLSAIPDDLFIHVPNLKMLNMQKANLHYLPNSLFAPLDKLESIELSSNQLTSLNSTTIGELSHLRLLNLWNNRIADIAPNTFDGLFALEALALQRNKLKTLPKGMLAHGRYLKSINLSQNDFTAGSLPADLLTNCTELRIFILIENRRNITTLPDRFFANLKNLSMIRLKKIGLINLPEDLFRGAINLTTLSLERNYLTTLPKHIFQDNKQIMSIDLSFNEISYLPDQMFSKLMNLVKLDLSRNHITSISSTLFNGLFSLRELNMERNNMTDIHARAFMHLMDLRIAKFSFNSLTLHRVEPTTGSPFQYSEQLEELHLDHNNIDNIFADWMYSMNFLRVLNLAHNNLQYLMHEDLQFLALDLTVDLTHNNITRVYLDGVESWAAERVYSRNLLILMENNPLECDCDIYDLLRYMEGRFEVNVMNAFSLEIGQTTCAAPRSMTETPIKKLRSRTFECGTSPISKSKDSCPDGCGCYLRPENKACLINCANGGFTAKPYRMHCPKGHSIELNFSGNSLTSMPGYKWADYDRISVLDLNHNNISSISVQQLPPNLKVLKLNNNALTRLDQAVLDYLGNSTELTELTLHSNPWLCDCEARQFLNFVQRNSLKLPGLMKVTCPERESTPVYQMTPEEFCPTNIVWIAVGCSLVALFGIILGSLAALYYRYQREIKVWLYAKNLCLWFVTESELDKDKIYDAFISYSHRDEDFVVNDLMPNLEAGPRPFKLCVHFRDWLAGEWIPKQIARSVEESRRTIVVLSPNFLESIWGRMEFRAAHSQALSEGRARLIVILFGDIGPTENLDPELRAYLDTNTYVKWGDPWFWQKLKYAMPHSNESTATKRQKLFFQTAQSPCVGSSNDKSELINTPSPALSDSMHIIINDDQLSITNEKFAQSRKWTQLTRG